MKNKIKLKKYLMISIITVFIFASISLILNIFSYKAFNKNVNETINEIIVNVKKNYPEVDINEIIQILNSNNTNKTNILEQYGINMDKDVAVLENSKEYTIFILENILLIFSTLIIVILILWLYNKNQNKKISEITKYIEEINSGNYLLDIQDNSEDELSILKNELYKTTVMLKEQSGNSLKDKLQLKKSLEDISHQLKTPLTSITIMLDNILDNPNMETSTRNEFIKDIYREITNINFFIQALLKLSKLDSNTIKFNRKEENISNIVNEAIKNVSMLCDLKNIDIIFSNEDLNINCDFKWEVEAITNILKNCVEHSKNSSKITIASDTNNMYSEIIIKDNGTGIDAEDLKHIFERFYKGKNSSKDSIGIGLSLAKTIIEKDNGYIKVDSKIDEGTKFSIRYIN